MAEQMKGIVQELVAIVGGSARNGDKGHKAIGTRIGARTQKAVSATGAKKAEAKVNPKEVIPMDDFQDC